MLGISWKFPRYKKKNKENYLNMLGNFHAFQRKNKENYLNKLGNIHAIQGKIHSNPSVIHVGRKELESQNPRGKIHVFSLFFSCFSFDWVIYEQISLVLKIRHIVIWSIEIYILMLVYWVKYWHNIAYTKWSEKRFIKS